MRKSTRETRVMKEVVRHISTMIMPLMLSLVMLGCGQGGGEVDTSSNPSGNEGIYALQITVYFVGGSVSGLSGSLVLQNNGGDDHAITSNGVFTFDTPLADGAAYDITAAIQPEGQVCTVSNGTGVVSGSDVTDVLVKCVFSYARVSVSYDGTEVFTDSATSLIGDNGYYVIFESDASDLVENDTNGGSDIFVYDRVERQVSRVSVASDGTEGNGISSSPAMSKEGRIIAFVSTSSNLVPGDDNNKADIFVHDLDTGITVLVSKSSSGVIGNGNSTDVFVSCEGEYIAFASDSTNLVPADVNRKRDVFVHDMSTGETKLVSKSSEGNFGNGMSKTPTIDEYGRYVSFASRANNLIADDYNHTWDIFVHDLETSETWRISEAPDGSDGNSSSVSPTIDCHGTHVVFISYASNLVAQDNNYSADVFVYDIVADTLIRASVSSEGDEANDYTYSASIDRSGKYVVFESDATNLVPDDLNARTDIFVRDIVNGVTTRVSVAYDGAESNGYSYQPSISCDALFVSFESDATNLVLDDFNNRTDIFIAPGQGS